MGCYDFGATDRRRMGEGRAKDGEGWVKDEMFHRNKLFLNLLSTKVKD